MQPQIRHAARALIITPQGEILLMRLNMPRGRVWLTPGGGLEAGETARQGLARELIEEVGRDDLTIGAEIWRRTVPYIINDHAYEQHERYFVVHSERFEASAAQMPAETEREWFETFHWWPSAQLRGSKERFGPRRIGALIGQYLQHGPPLAPIDVGR